MNNIPSGEHWAILTEESIYIPGDQRSIDAPGHGYPAHTERYINYRPFLNEEIFQLEFQKLISGPYANKQARGIHVSETYTGEVIIKAVKE